MLQIERRTLKGRQLVFANLLLLGVCLVTARISLWLALPGMPMTVFWPPAGLALAALVRYGLGLLPGAGLGALGAACFALTQSTPLRWPVLGAALMIAFGAMLGLWLAQRFLERMRPRLSATHHVEQLATLLGAGLIAAAISAVFGATGLHWAGVSPVTLLQTAAAWWLSCSLGIFLFTPLLLAWWGQANTPDLERRSEAITCLLLQAIATWWVFFPVGSQFVGGTTLGFLALPFLTWAALRLGYRATTSALVIVAVIGVLGLKYLLQSQGVDDDRGPFIFAARLLCVIPLTLCIAAVVRDRLETEKLLQQSNRELEARVNLRTDNLQQLTEQLRNEVEHQKQTAAALRESQERLELAIRAASIGYWDSDLATRTVHYSPEWKSQLGYQPEELPGNFGIWRELLHPEDREMAMQKVAAYLAGQTQIYEAEFRLRHKDGSYRWIHSRGNLECDGDGKPTRLMGCHLDITERKRANLKLETFAVLGQKLNAANTVREAAQLIVDLAEPLLGWDAAVLVMFDERTGLCRAVLDMDLVDGKKAHVPSVYQDKEPSLRMQQTIAQGGELVLRAAPVKWSEGFQPFGDQSRPSASMMFVPVRDGERTVGVLSIQSYQINAYTPADLDTLRAMADYCGGALARIRSREIQRESQIGLVSAQLQAKLGSWEFLFHSQRPQWSQAMYALIDRDPALGPMLFAEFIQHVHPEDQALVTDIYQRLPEFTTKHQFEFRYFVATRVRHFSVTLECLRDAEGHPVKATGVTQDITRQKQAEHEQARSYSLLQTTLESSRDGMLVVDRQGKVRLYNQRFIELWQLPSDLIEQRNDEEWLGFVQAQLENADEFLTGIRQLRTTPEQESFDVLTFKDGRMFERYSRPQRLEDQIVGRVWSFRDVTERRRNERLLLGQTKILEDIARGLDLVETLAEICRTAENSSLGMMCSVLLVDEENRCLRHGAAPSLPADCWQALEGLQIGAQACSCGTAVHREATVIVEDIANDPLWEGLRKVALGQGLRACWSTPIFDPTRAVIGTLAFYYNTPKRPTSRERRIIEMATHTAAIAIMKHRYDQELKRSAGILRQLSANLMDAHEAERRHLARELHDELGQTLTATKILLESHRHDIGGNDHASNGHAASGARPPASLQTAIRHVETLLQQIRNLSLSLRPTILDDCGLPAALRWLLDQHTQSTGRPAKLEVKYYEGEQTAAIQTACFRIAQEALTNISRHSQARQVNVELQCEAGQLTLLVRDDGVGFDVASATNRAHAGGSVGLLGQQERAALLGGRVEIVSQPGAGTEIRARFPLHQERNEVTAK